MTTHQIRFMLFFQYEHMLPNLRIVSASLSVLDFSIPCSILWMKSLASGLPTRLLVPSWTQRAQLHDTISTPPVTVLPVRRYKPITYIAPHTANCSWSGALRHRQSRRAAYRPQAKPAVTGLWPCGQTATRRPGLPFNGLHPRNPCKLRGLPLIYRPQRDGRLS